MAVLSHPALRAARRRDEGSMSMKRLGDGRYPARRRISAAKLWFPPPQERPVEAAQSAVSIPCPGMIVRAVEVLPGGCQLIRLPRRSPA